LRIAGAHQNVGERGWGLGLWMKRSRRRRWQFAGRRIGGGSGLSFPPSDHPSDDIAHRSQRTQLLGPGSSPSASHTRSNSMSSQVRGPRPTCGCTRTVERAGGIWRRLGNLANAVATSCRNCGGEAGPALGSSYGLGRFRLRHELCFLARSLGVKRCGWRSRSPTSAAGFQVGFRRIRRSL
jgi:hypothetical protein